MKRSWIQTILTIVILLGITTALYLYTAGYRVNREQDSPIDIKITGMIGAKSLPDGASVYVDGNLVTATDDTIAGLTPGEYNLRIVKNGFVEWEKTVQVFPELVTDITAILVSKSPRLEPLTNTGATSPTMSPSLTKLAYFSEDETSPGIWVIPLSTEGLSLFRSNPYVVLQDTPFRFYSRGKNMTWSPDETELLVETDGGIFFLVDLTTNTAQASAAPDLILEEWQKEITKKRQDFIEGFAIPEELAKIAISPETVWAPDEKKFLYKVETDTTIEYKVYNMEKPIPIGERVETTVLVLNKDQPQPELNWYSDSFHLVMTELDPENTTRGTISLIRIDGTNKTEVYNNTLYSNNVVSSPNGDKLIILTSFKSGDQTDLYTVSIR